MKAKVLNGEVEKGDKIAYATSSGSSLMMNIGDVLDVVELPHRYRGDKCVTKLRVRVTQSTSYHSLPREVVIGVLDRVVKL